jgi:hypothetical protein
MFGSAKSKGQQVDFQRVLADLSTATRQNSEKLTRVMRAQDALFELLQMLVTRESGHGIDSDQLARCSHRAEALLRECRPVDREAGHREPEARFSHQESAEESGTGIEVGEEPEHSDDGGTQRIPIVNDEPEAPDNPADDRKRAPAMTERFSEEDFHAIKRAMKLEAQPDEMTDIADLTPRTGEEQLLREKITEDVDIGDMRIASEDEPSSQAGEASPAAAAGNESGEEVTGEDEDPEKRSSEGEVVDLDDLR